MSKLEKVYSVEFMDYTDSLKDHVCDYSTIQHQYPDMLKVTRDPFLIKESDLMKFNKFGNGYRNIKLVGVMYIDDDEAK